MITFTDPYTSTPQPCVEIQFEPNSMGNTAHTFNIAIKHTGKYLVKEYWQISSVKGGGGSAKQRK